MKPLISIIVPVYNAELYLKECINSILSQSLYNLEVILINDGSGDSSGDICDEFSKKDPRIKVIHKEYGGVASARNVGIEIAQGEYLGFVDGDDRILENMYNELYELCKDTESDIAICKLGREINGTLINENKEISIKKFNHEEAMIQLFKGELYRFSLCNKLFKRKCFKNVRFPEGRIHEDLATTYKLFANSNKTVFTHSIGYIYVKRENSILTTRYNKKRLDAFLAWDEILFFMKQEYPHLYNKVISCYAYWAVDNIYYILNQLDQKLDRNDYLVKIRSYIAKYFKTIIMNNSLPLIHKYLISLLYFNTKLLILSINVKRFIKQT